MVKVYGLYVLTNGNYYSYWISNLHFPWETLAVREKHEDVNTASKSYRKNPTKTKALKLKKAQNELANIYLKEQNTYKIR